jgi:glycosyltransferase A (GT-A) superfamily protein (DUF2064 family)
MLAAASAPAHLLLFAHEPVLGRVKTRLAAGIGAEAALAVYRELLALTAAAVAKAGVPATVWLASARVARLTLARAANSPSASPG